MLPASASLPSVAELNAWSRNTMGEHLGIEITAVGEQFIEGRMPVDHRTHQPMGLLHGGASVVLAETLGSIGAVLQVDRTRYACVGLEINANHIKSVRSGYVLGRAEALHLGRTTQIWEIKIRHEETNALICVSRITMAVIELPAKKIQQ
ncbi:hotdog fold thioesterase [Hymenobacter sp. CRA2]|uniref:hotdog fold thioesterase n=1 Tax=Hymenobacter sp. CRA2 TaxID=1955620 RepID=UPI00098FB3C9|nr:hotdog fold thioesterase [Hymenobacter sp. CRA2]OON68512.1 thioesterase [Hymenobacter sp. CRA2]